MDTYNLSRTMKNIIKLSQRFTETDVDRLTPDVIHSINQRSIPNNRITRKLFNKPAKHISSSSFIIPVDNGNGAITSFLYEDRTSEASTGLRPLIVFFHGGGWIWGNMDLYAFYCMHLSSITESCVLSVDYRLAPKYKFPTAVEDCFDAFVWASAGTRYWKIDPDRIYLSGDSAGGCMAAIVSQLARDRKAPKIAGQILLYPITDCRFRTHSFETYRDSPTLNERQLQFYVKSYQREPKDILSPAFSPLLATDLSRLPPALIFGAEYDPLKDDGRLYADALNAAGSKARYFELAKTVHGYINYPRAVGAKETDDIIKQYINGRALDKLQGEGLIPEQMATSPATEKDAPAATENE